MKHGSKKGRLSGRTVGGRYPLGPLLDRGRGWERYIVDQQHGGSLNMAVTVLTGEQTQLAQLEALADDMEPLLSLRHPNLARLHAHHLRPSSKRDREPPLVVTDAPDGVTLEQHLKTEGALDPEAAAFILIQVINASRALDDLGLAHGGLEPRLVQIRELHLDHDDYVRVHLPLVGGAMLTALVLELEAMEEVEPEDAHALPFAAPEALLAEPPARAAEIFSVGALLYDCLTGQVPLPPDTGQESAEEIRDALLFQGPPLISEVRSGLPTELVTLVTQCLAKEPLDRPSGFDPVLAVLEEFAFEPGVVGCEPEPTQSDLPQLVPPAGTMGLHQQVSPRPPPARPSLSLGEAVRQASLARQPAPPPVIMDPSSPILPDLAPPSETPTTAILPSSTEAEPKLELGPEPSSPDMDALLGDGFATIVTGAPPKMTEQLKRAASKAKLDLSGVEPEARALADDACQVMEAPLKASASEPSTMFLSVDELKAEMDAAKAKMATAATPAQPPAAPSPELGHCTILAPIDEILAQDGVADVTHEQEATAPPEADDDTALAEGFGVISLSVADLKAMARDRAKDKG